MTYRGSPEIREAKHLPNAEQKYDVDSASHFVGTIF